MHWNNASHTSKIVLLFVRTINYVLYYHYTPLSFLYICFDVSLLLIMLVIIWIKVPFVFANWMITRGVCAKGAEGLGACIGWFCLVVIGTTSASATSTRPETRRTTCSNTRQRETCNRSSTRCCWCWRKPTTATLRSGFLLVCLVIFISVAFVHSFFYNCFNLVLKPQTEMVNGTSIS